MAAQTARVWREMPPAERRETACSPRTTARPAPSRCTGRAGPAHAAQRPPLLAVLATGQLPQRWAVTVGYQRFDLHRLCSRYHVAARITNRYHLANDELGLPIAVCHLRAPLGSIWHREIVRSSL